MLETSVASVNSALQRARATLDELALEDGDAPARPSDEDERRLLEQYLEAFAEYDIDRIVALLRYDVVFDMPPLPLWMRGPGEVATFMLGQGAACRGSKLIATSANGCPAFAAYKPDPESGAWLPWSVTVLELDAGEKRPGGRRHPQLPAPFMPTLFASLRPAGAADQRRSGGGLILQSCPWKSYNHAPEILAIVTLKVLQSCLWLAGITPREWSTGSCGAGSRPAARS